MMLQIPMSIFNYLTSPDIYRVRDINHLFVVGAMKEDTEKASEHPIILDASVQNHLMWNCVPHPHPTHPSDCFTSHTQAASAASAAGTQGTKHHLSFLRNFTWENGE